MNRIKAVHHQAPAHIQLLRDMRARISATRAPGNHAHLASTVLGGLFAKCGGIFIAD